MLLLHVGAAEGHVLVWTWGQWGGLRHEGTGVAALCTPVLRPPLPSLVLFTHAYPRPKPLPNPPDPPSIPLRSPPRPQARFPATFSSVTPLQLYEGQNVIRDPSLIRVESDEVGGGWGGAWWGVGVGGGGVYARSWGRGQGWPRKRGTARRSERGRGAAGGVVALCVSVGFEGGRGRCRGARDQSGPSAVDHRQMAHLPIPLPTTPVTLDAPPAHVLHRRGPCMCRTRLYVTPLCAVPPPYR